MAALWRPLINRSSTGTVKNLFHFQNQWKEVARLQSTSAHEKLYELRIYSIKPGNLKEALDVASVALPIRFKVSPAIGYWVSEIGGLNETVHIWEYASYGQRSNIRQQLGADKNWLAKSKPMIDKFENQTNCTMRLFPWSQLNLNVKPNGFYYFYQFSFIPGTAEEVMSSSLEDFVQSSELNTVGVWKEEMGSSSLLNAYAIFHSDHLDKHCPYKVPQSVWDKLRKVTQKVHGRVLSTPSWSPSK